MAQQHPRNTDAAATSTGGTAAAAAAVVIDEFEPLNDSFLMNLAEKLSTNYLQFGVYLGLTSNKIDQITFRYADLVVINFKILETWRNSKSPTESANVMFDNLREALLKIKRRDLEEQVQAKRRPKDPVKRTKCEAAEGKIQFLTNEVEALKMKVPLKPASEEQGERPKESERGNKQRVTKAMTEDRILILKAACRGSVEEEDEFEDGSKRRVLHVLSLLRHYGQAELWRHVSSDILEHGELDVSRVMSSAQLPDLTFLLTSDAATDVTSLNLGDNPDLHGPMMSVVSDSLVNSAQLEILKLSWCDLEDSDVITLTAALSSLGCLRVLQLAANSISDDGALRVAQTFVTLPRLEILGLYDNWLTEAGVKGVRRAAASTPGVWLAMLDVQRPPGQKLGHPDDVVFSQQQLDELQEGLSQPQGRPLATRSRWSGRHSVKVQMPRDAKSKIKRYSQQ